MSYIQHIFNTIYLFIFGGFFCLAVIALIYFYLIKVRKVTSYEEKIDYNSFKRVDGKDYIKFDAMVSLGEVDDAEGLGMVVQNKKEFIGAVRIYGTEFFDQTSAEQDYVIANAVAFMQTLGENVQFRGHVKKIDIKAEYDENMETAKEISKKIERLKLELNDTLEEMEDYISDEYEEEYNARKERCDAINKQLTVLKLDLDEALELAREYEAYNEKTFKPEHVNYIVYTFRFQEEEHSVVPKSKDEMYLLALRTLRERGRLYASALEACGCYVKQCNVKDVLESILYYINPVTAAEKDIEEVLTKDYGNLIVHSDTLEKRIKKRIGEKKWEEELNAYEEKLKKEISIMDNRLRKELEIVFEEMNEEGTYSEKELYEEKSRVKDKEEKNGKKEDEKP